MPEIFISRHSKAGWWQKVRALNNTALSSLERLRISAVSIFARVTAARAESQNMRSVNHDSLRSKLDLLCSCYEELDPSPGPQLSQCWPAAKGEMQL